MNQETQPVERLRTIPFLRPMLLRLNGDNTGSRDPMILQVEKGCLIM